MVRRVDCVPGRHNFQERRRKPGSYECRSCGTHFPCQEESCGHVDCADARGFVRCAFCIGKHKAGTQEERDGAIFTKNGATRWSHRACLEEHNARMGVYTGA